MSPGVLLHCVRQFRFVKFFHHTLSASTTLLKNSQPSLVREISSNSKPIFKLLRISPTSTPIASTLSTLRFHFQSNTRPPLFLHSIKMVQHRTISSSSSSSSSSTSSASTFDFDSTVTEFNVKLPPSLQFRNDASVLEKCRKWWTHFTKGRGLEEQFTGRTLGTMKVLKANKGDVLCELMVHLPSLNGFNVMHGGQLANLVDNVGGMAIYSIGTPAASGHHVSTDISISYLSPAPHHSRLLIHGRCVKIGKKMGFTEVVVWKAVEGKKDVANGKAEGTGEAKLKVVAMGRHTKMFISEETPSGKL